MKITRAYRASTAIRFIADAIRHGGDALGLVGRFGVNVEALRKAHEYARSADYWRRGFAVALGTVTPREAAILAGIAAREAIRLTRAALPERARIATIAEIKY